MLFRVTTHLMLISNEIEIALLNNAVGGGGGEGKRERLILLVHGIPTLC